MVLPCKRWKEIENNIITSVEFRIEQISKFRLTLRHISDQRLNKLNLFTEINKKAGIYQSGAEMCKIITRIPLIDNGPKTKTKPIMK